MLKGGLLIKIKIKDLVQFLYCYLYVCVLILNIYALYIDSLMPRLVSYALIVFILLMHFSTSGNKETKSLKKILFISLSFLVISLLSIVLYGNTSIFTFEFLWDVLQPSVFMLTGAVIAIRVEENNRVNLYKFLMVAILFTIVYDFGGQYVTYDSRHYSVYSNPLLYGSFILIAFHFVYYLVKNIYLKSFLLLLCVYACILTYSRSSWVALLITWLVSILFGKNQKLKIRKFISRCIFVVILFVVLITFGSQIEAVFDEAFIIVTGKFADVMQSTSAIFRIEAILYLWSKSSVLSIIFGHGVGATMALISNSVISISRFGTSDNQYITLIYDYGLIGIFWITKLMQLVFRSAFSNQKIYNIELKMLSIIVLSLMITGFFFETIGNANLAALTLSLIGILYQLDYEYRRGEEPRLEMNTEH